jgi:hypothetical protein
MTRAEGSRSIGGFMGLELPDGGGGLRKLWGVRDDRLAFVNASSAFAHLLEAYKTGAVWLPAYICAEFARAVPVDRLRYYPLDAELSPQVDALQKTVRSGDIVVAVDFFGRPPSASFLGYVSSHRDILFVEDCAQALDTAAQLWGDWRLYSPRKVVGVPDGGLLVACSARANATNLTGSVRDDVDAFELAKPQIARFEDTDETHNEIWHALNQAKEGSLSISNRRISRLSWSLLGLLDAEGIARKRRQNFVTLAARLEAWAFLPELNPQFVPLGFPVRLPAGARARVEDYLFKQRVFPAVHWRNLPSPAREFPDEHALAGTLLTLPCDQRYGAAEMEHVVTQFLEAVG